MMGNKRWSRPKRIIFLMLILLLVLGYDGIVTSAYVNTSFHGNTRTKRSGRKSTNDPVHGACVISLHEVFFLTTAKTFVEISKYCPPKASKSASSSVTVKGFFLFVIQSSSTTATITFVADLKEQKLKPMPETGTPITPVVPATNQQNQPDVTNLAPDTPILRVDTLTIREDTLTLREGTLTLREDNPTLREDNLILRPEEVPMIIDDTATPIESITGQPVSSTTTQNSGGAHNNDNVKLKSLLVMYDVPHFTAEKETYVTFLMYSKRDAGWSAADKRKLLVGTEITSEITDLMLKKATVMDAVVYTKGQQTELNTGVQNLLKGIDFPMSDIFNEEYQLQLQEAATNHRSLSKCDFFHSVKVPLAFFSAVPSPQKENHCHFVDISPSCDVETDSCRDRPLINFPYTFVGATITSQSQKLIMNLKASLDYLKIQSPHLRTTSLQQVGQLVNLHYNTVSRIVSTIQRVGVLPGQKRKITTSKVIRLMTPKNQEILRDSIKSFYKQHIYPTATEIFRKFLEAVRLHLLEEAQTLPVDPDFTVDKIPESSCNFWTFRKMLKLSGFKFGKVDNRLWVVQRPEIVALRANYLAKRKTNEDKRPPLPVVFTDETWFDTNSRPGKSWLPSRIEDLKEHAQYTAQMEKIGRGPRLIILAMGGKDDGMIRPMNEVYAITKDKKDDYHKNIDQDHYEKWFRKSCIELQGPDKANPKQYVIVIDNAPVHTVLDAPWQNRPKKIILEYLKAKEQEKEMQEILKSQVCRGYIATPHITDGLTLKKLKVILKEWKDKQEAFTVEKIAQEHGHFIYRLPPYGADLNPIELVWSDLKRHLRKVNVDQSIQKNEERAKLFLNSYERVRWVKHVEHVERIERKYREQDGLATDQLMEKLLEANDVEDVGDEVAGGDELSMLNTLNEFEDLDESDDEDEAPQSKISAPNE